MPKNTDLEVAEHFEIGEHSSTRLFQSYVQFKSKAIKSFGAFGYIEYLLQKKR